MNRNVIKSRLANFVKETHSRKYGLEHYLNNLENAVIPIKKSAYENAMVYSVNNPPNGVILFFNNKYPNNELQPTHIYHLIQLVDCKESAKKIGAVHLILNKDYPTWLNSATFNSTLILGELYEEMFTNLQNEKMYSDKSIIRTLDNLLKWDKK